MISGPALEGPLFRLSELVISVTCCLLTDGSRGDALWLVRENQPQIAAATEM